MHLSEEALDDLLIGDGPAESEAHLAACPECRAKVEAFQSDLALFNKATLCWGEVQSATMPAPQARSSARRLPLAIAAWGATVAGLLMAVGVPVWRHAERFPASHQASSIAPTADTELQIAQDNELLKAVDMAINQEEASPLSEPSLAAKPHSRHRQRQMK